MIDEESRSNDGTSDTGCMKLITFYCATYYD